MNSSIEIIAVSSIVWTVNRTFGAVIMCCVNKKFSNEVDGIIVPVAYAVGPNGNKAMAGA